MPAPPIPPRLAPARALPPYAFLPGHWPHPVRDPAGHSYGHQIDEVPPDATSWRCHEGWLHALDLFNAGYYWEAHEGFEGWWKAAPEGDARRALFQGLLRLSAAGVKARLGHHAGVHSHATRAEALLMEAGAQGDLLLGLRPAALARLASDVALRAASFRSAPPQAPPTPVLGILLMPSNPA